MGTPKRSSKLKKHEIEKVALEVRVIYVNFAWMGVCNKAFISIIPCRFLMHRHVIIIFCLDSD